MGPPVIKRHPSSETIAQSAEALNAALSNLIRVYQFRDRDMICCHDISVTQWYALEILVDRGVIRSQVLADALRLDKSTTTRVVDSLVRKGYVERAPEAEDRRAVALKVTRTGRALYERINRELIAQQGELLRDLDPRVWVGAIEVIQRLARAAEARLVSDGRLGSCAAGPADGCGSEP